MTQPEYCLLDIDGVMTNFVSAACKEHHVPSPYEDKTNHGRWDIATLLDMEDDDFWEPLGYSYFWESLPLMDDALEIFVSVLDTFPSDNIAFCSTPARSPSSAKGKLRWIEQTFPPLRRHFILTPKKHMLAHPGALLIDDSNKNVDRFRNAGGHAILVPRPWNSLHEYSHAARDVVNHALKSGEY